jgi:NitT/TauT family transport system substrate-binding protein
MNTTGINKTTIIIGALVVASVVTTAIIINRETKVALPTNQISSTQTSAIAISPTKVKIGYIAVTQALPLFIAEQEKIFTSNNIEAELVKFEQPTQLMESFLTGQIDVVGFTGATGILSIANSKNPEAFKILNSGYASSENPVDVLVAKDPNSKSIIDLKGKTCGILAGPQFKAMFTKVAKDGGLSSAPKGTLADINYQEMPVSDFGSNLASGNIECVLGLEPFGSVAESKKIGKIITKAPISQALGGRFYGVTSAVNKQFLDKNPSIAKNIVTAFDKALELANSPTLEQKQNLMTKIGLPLSLADKLPYQRFVTAKNFSDQDISGIKAITETMMTTGNQQAQSNLDKAIWIQ